MRFTSNHYLSLRGEDFGGRGEHGFQGEQIEGSVLSNRIYSKDNRNLAAN